MKTLLLFLSLSSLLFSSIHLPPHFRADFIQKVTNNKNKVLTYTGKITFSENTYFKWEYKTPSKKEVCSNAVQLIVVDHDLEQVSSYFINNGLDISKVLLKAKLHKNTIYLAHYEDKTYTIQLNKKKQLHSIAYFDDLDNKVQIIFKKMYYGKKFLNKTSTFCKKPPMYDKIKG
jgi:outer membrane lipoprotein carrier protein